MNIYICYTCWYNPLFKIFIMNQVGLLKLLLLGCKARMYPIISLGKQPFDGL